MFYPLLSHMLGSNSKIMRKVLIEKDNEEQKTHITCIWEIFHLEVWGYMSWNECTCTLCMYCFLFGGWQATIIDASSRRLEPVNALA